MKSVAEQPAGGGCPGNAVRQPLPRRGRIERHEKKTGVTVRLACRPERAYLPLPGRIAARLQADLHEQRRFARAVGVEIDLPTLRRADVGDLPAAPFQLQQDGGLQRVTLVGAPTAREQRDQPRVAGYALRGLTILRRSEAACRETVRTRKASSR